MTVLLSGTTDLVQLPPDSTGKRTAARLVTLNGVSIYLPASMLIDDAGNTLDSATGLLTTTSTPTQSARGLVTWSQIQGAPQPSTTGTITSATSTVTTGNLEKANTIGLTIRGTYAGVNVSFEVSDDNTNWGLIQGGRVDTGGLESASGVIPSNTTRQWNFTFGGFVYFRVRATAWTSGTANVNIDPGTLALAPVVAATIAGQPSATATVTNVSASATNVTLKAANTSRKALYIMNAGTSSLYAKLGATATTTTSYTYMVQPNGFWELPDDPIYTGQVDGIWAATGGNGALMTELT
jgi:hypothetical protein